MKRILLALIAATFISTTSFAAETCLAPTVGKDREWKECKRARPNDPVDEYDLRDNGGLFAYIKKINRNCQVTDGVKSFKVSGHPQDAAMIYYVRGDDLYVLHKEHAVDGDCPKTSKKVIMNQVEEYKIVPNTETTIVNAARDSNGMFTAWDNDKAVYIDKDVKDFQMNTCFGQEGKSFNSYAIFTLDREGHVTKIKGEKSGYIFSYIKDKATRETYKTIAEFKKKNNVCD